MKPLLCILSAALASCAIVDTSTPTSYDNPGLWGKRALSWAVDHSTAPTLSPEALDADVAACFAAWEPAGVFTFHRAADLGSADIKIAFGTLADTGHAAFPWQAARGTITLSNSDRWGTGFALLGNSVRDWLPHEIGHALGLKHTLDDASCMRQAGPYGMPTVADLNRLRAIYSPGRPLLTWKLYDQ